MDVDNALHKFRTAQRIHARAIETIQALTRGDDDRTVKEMISSERFTWRRLDAARHELIEACLESIGR